MTRRAVLAAIMSYFAYLDKDVHAMIIAMNPGDVELNRCFARFMRCVEDDDCKTKHDDEVLVMSLVSMYLMDKRIERESKKLCRFCKGMYSAHK